MSSNSILSLLEYLRELANLRTKIVRDVADYDAVYWLADLPKVKGCYTRAWGAIEGVDDDLWLEVCRQPEPRLPAVPKVCEPWIIRDRLRDIDNIPTLLDQVPEPIPQDEPQEVELRETRFLSLSNYPEVSKKWEAYIKERWLPWLEEYRRWREVDEAYSELFSVYQNLQRLGEEFELVLAEGFLTWKRPTGAIRRHVLAASTSLEFDAERGVFQVRPGADGAKLSFEMEIFEGADRPPANTERGIVAAVQESGDPWQSSTVYAALRSLVQTLHERGAFDEGLSPHQGNDDFPVLTFAPALILRKRLPRGFLTMVAKMKEQIEEGAEAPPALARWLTLKEAKSSDHPDSPGQDVGESADSRVYFPLPANNEQLRIIDLLRRHDVVLVQGPPGTGKSHTIANLICHLLATGQRVLVTAQTPRALKVLQDKLPEEVQPLCVSVLGNDRMALEGLERSVASISGKHARWDERQGSDLIGQIEEKLDQVQRQRATAEGKLRQIREADSYVQEVAGGAYRGTAQRIAAQWASQRERFGWFNDRVSHEVECPFGPATLEEYLKLCIEIDAGRQAELKQSWPNPARVPSIEDFDRFVQQEKQAQATASQYSHLQGTRTYEVLSKAPGDAVRALATAIGQLVLAIENTKHRPLAWIPNAVREILADHETPWFSLQRTSAELLEGLADRVRATESHDVVVPPEFDFDRVLADAEDLKAHLDKGGRLRRWGMRPAIVKRAGYLLQSVRVDGRPCENSAALEVLIERLKIQRTINRLWDAWQGKRERVTGGLAAQVSDLLEQLEALNMVVSVNTYLAEAEKCCEAIQGLPQCAWHDEDVVCRQEQSCAAALAARGLVEHRRTLNALIESHRAASQVPSAHPVYARFLEAIGSRDVSAFGFAVETLQRLAMDEQRLLRRNEIGTRLAAVAPQLAVSLAGAPDDPGWAKVIPEFADAWNWARTESWLHEVLQADNAPELENEAKNLTAQRERLLAELSATKAWYEFFKKATGAELTHLKAWQRAVAKIGKGTSKYLGRYQRDAQENLDHCRSVVPAWIMPLYRVFETVMPVPGMFDVVIVDEASQCGPDALLLLFLAKKVVIVGDNKQISPQAVGLNKEGVFQLIERHLGGVELAATFDPGTSLYDHAAMREGKSQVVLREHFRCVPEIIRFNNDQFYQTDPLIPLRQYPPDRLRPVVCRCILDGYVEGSSQQRINRPEAEALVRAIVACNADPYYEAKTFGVVSLLGEEQASLVEQLLLEQLGAEDIEGRRLICGDAYSFPGLSQVLSVPED